MKNIHLLPTDKPSRLHFDNTGLFLSKKYQLSTSINSIVKGKNIYITSDEKPRQGDWCLDLDTNTVFKIGNWETNRAKKIILTDNEDLIKDGVQAIDDEFLEWFCSKNGKVDFVEMKLLDAEEKLWEEYYKKNSIYPKYPWYYKIIIPKEEPKQETLENHYLSTPNPLVDISIIKLDNHPDLHKQETLEEVAERYYEENIDQSNIPREHYEIEIKDLMIGFAYKWQQEQDKNLYSEEEVRRMFDRYNEVIAHRNIEEWQPWIDKQFKKK